MATKKTTKKARTSEVKTHAYSTPRHLGLRGQDPDKAYYYAKKDDGSVGIREQMGWSVAKRTESLQGPGKKDSSTIETHDLILLEMPKEMHDQIKDQASLRSKARINGVAPAGLEVMETTETPNDHLQNDDNSDIFNKE